MSIDQLQCLVSYTICVNFMDITFLAKTEDELEFLYCSAMEIYLKSMIVDLYITATNNIIRPEITIRATK